MCLRENIRKIGLILGLFQLVSYILPTRSRPGFKVSFPGSQFMGQTSPPCWLTNWAAWTFLISSFVERPMELSCSSKAFRIPSGSIMKVPLRLRPSSSM